MLGKVKASGNKEIVKRTYKFAIRIVKLCQVLDDMPGVSRIMSKQLLRSGTSIGANVEEGQAGQTKQDFIYKMTISLKEARETKYWLRLLRDSDILSEKRLKPLIDESYEIANVLAQIIINNRKTS